MKNTGFYPDINRLR